MNHKLPRISEQGSRRRIRTQTLSIGLALTLLLTTFTVLFTPTAAMAERGEPSNYDEQRFINAGFNTNYISFEFYSTSDRLARNQTGDQGMTWEVAGPKDFDSKRVANWNADYLPPGTEYERPRSRGEQREAVMEDMRHSCLRGPQAAACGWTWYQPGGIAESYFGHAKNFRTNGWMLYLGFQFDPMWVIHLEDANGGLPWASRWWDGEEVVREYNYGTTATVGRMKEFIRGEMTSDEGSDYYRHMMGRALEYLNIVYAAVPDDYPIEWLAIPREFHNICLEPVGRDQYGTMQFTPVLPVKFMGAAPTPQERALTCPSHDDGYWEYRYESEIAGYSDPSETRINAPYAMWTAIEDQSPSGVGSRPFDTQREQALTPLGQLLTDLCATREEQCDDGTVFTDAEIQQLLSAASRSHDVAAPRINLTDNNRQALADGRLVQVSEQTQSVLITRTGTRDRYMRRWMGTKTYYDEHGRAFAVNTTGDWQWANMPERDRDASESRFELGTPSFNSGYQILVNHCNGDSFRQVAGDRSIDDRAVGNELFTGFYLAGTAVSDVYGVNGTRPWGVAGPTAETGFYDKVCSYQGVRTDSATEQPTTAKVDGDTNVFRDGQLQHLPTSYFTPVSDGWVQYQGDGPVGFTSTRWEGGTPVPGQFFLAGKSCTNGSYSKDYFGASTAKVPVLKQWDIRNFSSSTVTMGEGCYREFGTRGVWASDKYKPQVLTMKWDFRPEVQTITPTRDIGVNGDDASYTAEVVGARVRGQVTSHNHPTITISKARQGDYLLHTGSGTENLLDVPVPYGVSLDDLGRWTTAPNMFDPHYYAVSLVRAIGS